MAKKKTAFYCKECGNEYVRWQGKCDGCFNWNTLEESITVTGTGSKAASTGNSSIVEGSVRSTNLNDVDETAYKGISTQIEELDRVLGGKLVHGSITLISGEPGKGKSTLLLQTAANIANSVGKVLYHSGEEAEHQIKHRATRMGIKTDNLELIHTQDLATLELAVQNVKPAFLIVDSVQTIKNNDIGGELGSTKQIKDCTTKLVQIAKSLGISVFVVGQVTKDDSIAGPRMLEHMVDTVLYLEGEPRMDLRLLRAKKNRFGADNELGLFEMRQEGMVEIKNPSDYLISNKVPDSSGSAIVCVSDTRPMLIEVQSLVSPPVVENAIPRRTSEGYSRNRLNIITAILEKKCGIKLAHKDIYLNVVGGMALDKQETSADLGIALAIASSDKEKAIDADTVILGELGLAGEVRRIANIEQLVKEAERNGYKRCILPQGNMERAKKNVSTMELIPVGQVYQAINHFNLGKSSKKKTS